MWATIEPGPLGELSRESLSEPLRHYRLEGQLENESLSKSKIRMKEDRGVRDPARSFGFAHVLPASARVATVRPIDWYRFPSRGALLRPRRDHRRNRGGAGGRDHGGKECADGEGARRQGQSERIPFRDPIELCRDQPSSAERAFRNSLMPHLPAKAGRESVTRPYRLWCRLLWSSATGGARFRRSRAKTLRCGASR